MAITRFSKAGNRETCAVAQDILKWDSLIINWMKEVCRIFFFDNKKHTKIYVNNICSLVQIHSFSKKFLSSYTFRSCIFWSIQNDKLSELSVFFVGIQSSPARSQSTLTLRNNEYFECFICLPLIPFCEAPTGNLRKVLNNQI